MQGRLERGVLQRGHARRRRRSSQLHGSEGAQRGSRRQRRRRRAQAQLQKAGRKAEAILGSALTDEKQLAAHKLAVMHFSDQVSSLRDDAERFEARLERLERSKQ